MPTAEHLGLTPTIRCPMVQGKLTGKHLQEAEGSRGRIDDVDGERTEHEETGRAGGRRRRRRSRRRARPGRAGPSAPGHRGRGHDPRGPHPDQLEENLASLEVELEAEHRERLDEGSAQDPPFPQRFLQAEGMEEVVYGGMLGEIDTERGW